MEAPARIGRFVIERELGRGAMGLVYLAHDPKIDRKVAIKTIHGNDSLPEAEAEEHRQRFLREAQAAGKLIHAGIVTIFDVGEDQGLSYIAMEFIEGHTLEAATKREGALATDLVLRLMIQACDALDYAHQFKIIHRDIKPANLMLVAGRNLKITDFGLAKNPSANLTSAGTLIGTPNYMSPDQIMGKALDGRSDLFSLGVVLYELLTGERPFGGDTISTIIYKVLHEIPKAPDLVNPRLPAPVSAAILRAIEKDPAKRFQSGAEFAAALREYLEMTSTQARAGEAAGSGIVPRRPSAADASPAAAWTAPPRGKQTRPPVRPPRPPPRRRRSVILPVMAALLVPAAGAGYYFYPRVRPWVEARLGMPPSAQAGEAERPAEGLAGVETPAPLPGPDVDLPEPTPEGETISIQVGTEPAGGRLYLDDREVHGGTILLGKDDKATHTLVAENDCLVDSVPVRTTDAGPVVVTLKTPKLHEIRVASEPSGARIILDGKVQEARTPSDLNVAACAPHTIGARLAGFQEAERDFPAETAWAGVSPVDLVLEALPDGFVAVKAPYDLAVYEGSQKLGAGDGPIRLTAGSHKLRYVNEEHFVDIGADVDVPPGQTVNPGLRFPGLGSLTIHANPGNGIVFLNGRKVGSPPLLGLSLAEGTYQVRYVVDSGPVDERTVLVLAGQSKTEKIILKP